MKILFCFFLFIILIVCTSISIADITINEVMYAPTTDFGGSSNEWIELYTYDTMQYNLSECTLNNKSLHGIINDSSYVILVRNKEKFIEIYETNFTSIVEVSFGRGLSNKGAEIILNCNDNFDNMDYDGTLGIQGKTLEMNKDGEWKESLVDGGTPGMKNSVYDFSYDYSDLEITEIMVDPLGDDDATKPLGEWIELYNSGDDSVYLDGLVLYDEDDANELYITKTNTNTLELCSKCYTVVYRDNDGDFDLSKVEDSVRLYTGYPISDNLLIDEISFTNAIEGTSFSKFDNGWYKTVPTPGNENKYTAGCDWKIEIDMNNSIFHTTDMDFDIIVSRIFGEKQNVTVKGIIENVFGEPIKEYSPWTNKKITTSNTKKYTPNLHEGVYQIRFWIESLMCGDTDNTNNDVTKLVAINPQYKETTSSLEIERMYLGNDNKAEWGDQFTAKINVYKGNETRYSVQVWVEKDDEKVSKTTKLSIHDQYKQYPLTIPIQLEPNCNNKIDDGNVLLVVEAFGLRTEKEFLVKGVDNEICKDYLDYIKDQEDEIERKKVGYRIIEKPLEIFSGEIFPIKVQLLNGNDVQPYTVWSYMYRGSTCYSCDGSERDGNKQRVILQPDEVQIVEFLLKADDVQEGEYKIKVKVQKGNQKTVKDITETITVVSEKKTLSESLPLFVESGGGNVSSPFSSKTRVFGNSLTGGVVVYESSGVKAKKLIPVLLFVTFGLVCLVLIWKK
ncbi:hypothetical protein HOL21_01280 [Candidatus Woesearchaeota archaeon]|jgi:hypothetical protein|nr:hypothetical protein [Candidatus Woesearchaeota archaeon]MBT5396825.1 hypothetical protein [Candidatus Woesearchaeota archaeon]MBT6367713.1 hypothetical protein [Candidatus Woesearchaeota archaeon]MBT7762886.1 hypothetical protein [Candidatus Woesearchaeota archaeon]